MRIDLVNPWQRQEAARLIRLCRKGGAINPLACASRMAAVAIATANYDDGTAQAYAFISAQLCSPPA